MTTAAANLSRPCLSVRWGDLPALDSARPYRWARQCPACPEGIVVPARCHRTLRIRQHARCLLCAQMVRWLDWKDLRARDWAP